MPLMNDDNWPSYRRPITGQLYSEPCRCPHCIGGNPRLKEALSMPLGDELSDIRYAPTGILIRGIRKLAEMVVDVSGGAYSKKLVLSEVGLMDGEDE